MADVPLYLSRQANAPDPFIARLGKALYNAFTMAVFLFAVAYTITAIGEQKIFFPGLRNVLISLSIGLGVGLYNQFVDYKQRFRIADESGQMNLEKKGQWLNHALETASYTVIHEDENVSIFRPRLKLRRLINLDNRIDIYQVDSTFDLVAPRSLQYRVNKTLELLQKAYYHQ